MPVERGVTATRYMETCANARDRATPVEPIRPDPDPAVSAEVVGSFRMGSGPRIAVVDLTATASVAVTVLVGPGRVSPPRVRGVEAVRFEDRSLAREAYKAALAAYDQSFGEVQP